MLNAVFISNVDASATSDIVKDFFVFCGEVLSVELHLAADGTTQDGEVIFATAEAKAIALLLNGSVLADRSVVVAEEDTVEMKEPESEAQTSPVAAERKERVPEALPSSEETDDGSAFAVRSREVIVSLLGHGYVLGSQALEYVRSLNEERRISQQVRTKVEEVVAKAKRVDVERAGGAGARAVERGVGLVHATLDKGQELANTHLDPLAASTLAQGQAYAGRALEHPKVAAGWQVTKGKLLAARSWAVKLGDEARARIEQEQQRRQSEREEAQRARAAANFSIDEPADSADSADDPAPPPYLAVQDSEQGVPVGEAALGLATPPASPGPMASNPTVAAAA